MPRPGCHQVRWILSTVIAAFQKERLFFPHFFLFSFPFFLLSLPPLFLFFFSNFFSPKEFILTIWGISQVFISVLGVFWSFSPFGQAVLKLWQLGCKRWWWQSPGTFLPQNRAGLMVLFFHQGQNNFNSVLSLSEMVLHRVGGEIVLHKLFCGVKHKSSGRAEGQDQRWQDDFKRSFPILWNSPGCFMMVWKRKSPPGQYLPTRCGDLHAQDMLCPQTHPAPQHCWAGSPTKLQDTKKVTHGAGCL